MFQMLKIQIELYLRNDDNKINAFYNINAKNILEILITTSSLIDRIIDSTNSHAYMLSLNENFPTRKTFSQDLNETN
jgi:hypothetical protein